MKHKLLSLALGALLSLSTLAPAHAQDKRVEPGAKHGGTLRVAFDRWPQAGLLSHNNSWIPLFQNQFESLVKADDAGNYHPWLAKSWEISPDGLVYTFTLREDVVFQDDDKFNAQAVKTTFDKLLSNTFTLTPPKRNWAEFLDSVDVIDDYTIRFRFNQPDAIFLSSLASNATGIASPSSISKAEAKQGGVLLKGTGPFELVEVVPDQKFVFKRFDRYQWAPPTARHDGPAYLDQIVFNWVPDPAVRTGLLTSGQVDFITTLGPDDVPLVKDNPAYVYIERTGNIVPWTWFFNTDGFGTSDIRVREAIIEALDLETLVKAIYRGNGAHAWSQIAPGSAFYDPSYAGSYGNHPDRANQLLDQAGWTGRNAAGVRTNAQGQALELKLLNRGFTGRQKLFTEAAQQLLLQKAGIQLVIENADEAQGFIHRDKGDYSIFHVTVAGFDVGAALNLLWPTKGIINFSRLSDPKVDALNRQQRHTLDPAQRTELIRQLADYTQKDLKLALPIVEEFQNIAATSAVRNADTTFAPLRSYPGPIAYDVWLDR